MRWALHILIFLLLFVLGNNTVLGQTDSSQSYILDKVQLSGNKITKDYILLRELDFGNQDSIVLRDLPYKMWRSEKNIFNTTLFHVVKLDFVLKDSNLFDLNIHVIERWYIWPLPILENADRNFNTWWETKKLDRLSYGLFLNWQNFRGRNEQLQVYLKTGFEQELGLDYVIPFVNRKKTIGLVFSSGYITNREVNFNSTGNKRNFLKDDNAILKNEVYLLGRVNYRWKLYGQFQFMMSYTRVNAADTLLSLAPDYLQDAKNTNELMAMSLQYKYDKRDYAAYPLKGNVLQVYAIKQGLAVFENTLNILELEAVYHHHYALTDRWYGSHGIKGKHNVLDAPPYRFQRGFGYNNDFIRGYEYYVMDASDYVYLKNNLKYNLIKPKCKQVSWIKNDKFSTLTYALYASAFFDVGYANDRLYASVNPLSNQWIYGYGVGFDFVTFYDIVTRLEFSRNAQNENGIYLHFKKSI